MGLYYWGEDFSYYDFWKQTKIITDKNLIDKIEKLKDALSDCSYGFITDKIAIVLTKPKVEVNAQWRLDSDKGMALKWKDGTGQYFLSGVEFEEKLWKQVTSGNMTAQEVFAIGNNEQRRIAYERMDKVKMKELKDFKVLDEKTDNLGKPMKIISFTVKGFEKPFIYLNVVDASTDREYFVQTEKEKCIEAKNASFGLENIIWEKEY
ncbi:MAG: hypothetical protein U1E54_03415 [Candidatus Levybacteria bacterium]|nr:hypothetical protein [Candidatus Levybacteria bacterium]